MARAPGVELLARQSEHGTADRRHEPTFIGERDEAVRQDETAVRVAPAREGLEPDHASRLQLHDRLVVGLDLVSLDRALERGCELVAALRLDVHLGVVPREAALAI